MVCGPRARQLRPICSHHLRVDDEVPERPDRGHVGDPEQSVRLRVDGHLAAVAARPVRDPADVHDAVHGPVGDLRRPLVVDQVERGERERAEVRAGRSVAQIRRQPVAERRHPGAEAGVRVVPTEQLPELPPDREERADGAGGALRRVARGEQLHQPREVVRAAWSRQRPHVLEPEVAGELMDPPGPGGVRGVREPHRRLATRCAATGLSERRLVDLDPEPGPAGSRATPCSALGAPVAIRSATISDGR